MAYALKIPLSLRRPPFLSGTLPTGFCLTSAIDLIDEAASKLRIEIDSMPVELDGIRTEDHAVGDRERRLLRKKRTTRSKQRMEKIEKQLSDLREESGALRAQWENEKKAIKEIQDISAKIDQARVEEQTAQREGNLGKVAEIRYGLIPGSVSKN